jgi:arylsulfatase A-like enzyme
MNAICLAVDRLHSGHLGAYGNAWIDTPVLDRLASQSFVFDQAILDSPQLDQLYRSYWQGWHALCPSPPPESRPSLPALLRDAGVTTVLLTDEPQVARHRLAVDFDELIEIDPPVQPQLAETIEQTHFARCFVQIMDRLENAKSPFLLWCHLSGLGTAWDAPFEFRQRYWEEGDPQPPSSADVPDLTLPADYDPDELLGTAHSYAGQVSLFDTCVGAFLEFLDGLPIAQETLLSLASTRGFPLGEHRRAGPCDNALFAELVHVPWMIRFPNRLGAATRSHALVEPADLWATLLELWQVDAPPASPTAGSVMPLVHRQVEAIRDRLCIQGVGAERAIRTPAWYLRSAVEPELYAKPSDRWDMNNVASRCQEVVECLQDALLQCELVLPTGRFSELPPLNDLLLNGFE